MALTQAQAIGKQQTPQGVQPADLTQALIQRNQQLEQKVQEQGLLLGLLLGGNKKTDPAAPVADKEEKGLNVVG